MKRTSVLSLSCALIALCGVLIASPAVGTEDSASQYFPLTVGNRWVYESTEYPDDRVTDESWEVLREEEDSLVEGSFSIHPTLKDRVVLKLKEWQVSASES